MRRGGSVLALATVVIAVAGCGGTSPTDRHALNAFFTSTARGRSFSPRFPHRPGSLPCTAYDDTLGKRVPATCSTDVLAEPDGGALATFTVSWNHGSLARTWFVRIRADGSVMSVRKENPAG